MPTDTTAGLNMTVTVQTAQTVGKPTQGSVYNEYDDFGLLVGLDRLPGEKNAAFKGRLTDAFSHRANSTYLGMIYGVTRELNLSLFKPFRLRPRVTSNMFNTVNPVFEFIGPFLNLWSNKAAGTLEMEIDIYNQTGPCYTIGELFAYINANSTTFIADQLDTTHQYDRSMTIINQTNVQNFIDPVHQTDRFTLSQPGTDGGAIQLDNLMFTDKTAFISRQTTFNAVTDDGDWYINQYTGDINVHVIPAIGTLVKYKYIKYNKSFLVASPVIIHNIQNPNFERLMFEQKLADDGKYYNGVPTEFGSDIVNELLSVFPLNYGE